MENKTKKKCLKENVNELLVAFESTQLSAGGREDNCLFIELLEGRISSLERSVLSCVKASVSSTRWIIASLATNRRQKNISPISGTKN